jgi:23S rRNA pseudouridine1911/1915/1917 synthase
VLYADAHVVAVDKPPGMPSVAGASPRRSLSELLIARYPEMVSVAEPRSGGLVHRLDTATSGVLLAARDPTTHRQLRAEFTARRVEKEYLAVVVGRMPVGGTVDRPLGRRRGRARMVAASSGARSWPARTDFAPLRHAGELTLVRLWMRTGVTHQLRVHLAGLGHPILGDTRYGPRDAQPAAHRACGWHFLHAATIRLRIASLPAAIEAPFPDHWTALFDELGWPREIPPTRLPLARDRR